MADDPKKEEGEKPGGSSLKEQIREVLGELGIGGGKKPADDEKPAPGDLQAQVAEAVRQVREGDEAARKQAALEQRLAELEAQRKTPEPEKKPNERRRIERLMGWVLDDE